MMPKMNGFEFLEAYRSEFEKQAPVVVITGADLDENDKSFYPLKQLEYWKNPL